MTILDKNVLGVGRGGVCERAPTTVVNSINLQAPPPNLREEDGKEGLERRRSLF
jgi:hypothetical protein